MQTPNQQSSTNTGTTKFRANTLRQGDKSSASSLVKRTRILDFINRESTLGTISWIVGPVGAGKTTVAHQWASELDTDVQYVSARPSSSPAIFNSAAPSSFGTALASLANACAKHTDMPSEEEIGNAIREVVRLSHKEGSPFILDNLEFLRRSGARILLSLLPDALAEIDISRAILISRTIDPHVLSGVQSSLRLQMVLPNLLDFTREDAAEGQRIGVFGTATPEQVEAARQASHGWITGMLARLHGHGGRTLAGPELRNIVLNDLLLHQQQPELHILIASSLLPVNTLDIWKRWFNHFDIPLWVIDSLRAQFPNYDSTEHPGEFHILPMMKKALRELRNYTTSEDIIHDLLIIAMDSFVENEDIGAANSLAAEHDLYPYLLESLRNICVEHADKEDWSAIVETVKLIPDEQLLKNSDLTFWYFHGLVERDKWAQMERLSKIIVPQWAESKDPLVAGRAHLIRSFNAYMLSKGGEAFRESRTAYELLPTAAHRERLWATGMASIACSLEGFTEDARRWAGLGNVERTFLGDRSRWWHNTAGPLRFSWLAIVGMLDESYEFASQVSRNLGTSNSPELTRYLLLMALIDIERQRNDSAAELLAKAHEVMEDRYSQEQQYRLVEAAYCSATGDLDTASDLLSTVRSPAHLRVDQFSREMVARAHLALLKGDPDAARLYLSGSATNVGGWPKQFGDPHPGLVAAMIDHLQGRNDKAIGTAQSVLKESEHRNHRYYVVNAHATLAFIHNTLGRDTLRDRAIAAAETAAGSSGFQRAFIVGTQDVRQLASSDGEPASASPQATPHGSSVDRLTTREIEVLTLASKSFSNQQIADKMFISISTVKNHLASVYDKLGTNNRRSAVRIARDFGIIDYE